MKIPYAAAVGVAAAVLAFGVPNALAQTPKSGGTLTFAVSAEPPNYDCHAQSSFAFIHPVRPHYSTLLKFDTRQLSRRWSATWPNRGRSLRTA